MNSHGISMVISAPSGAGKSTLCKRLLKDFPNLSFSVSCATRKPRPGEINGVDYNFISSEQFQEMARREEFAEWAVVHGNYYGTPLKGALERLEKGMDVLFDVDVQGALQIKNRLPGSLFVFILPPSMAELKSRLRGRGNDDDATMAIRLRNARAEILQSVWYDSIIVNDDLEKAYDHLRSVYLSARCRPGQMTHLIESLLIDGQISE